MRSSYTRPCDHNHHVMIAQLHRLSHLRFAFTFLGNSPDTFRVIRGAVVGGRVENAELPRTSGRRDRTGYYDDKDTINQLVNAFPLRTLWATHRSHLRAVLPSGHGTFQLYAQNSYTAPCSWYNRPFGHSSSVKVPLRHK